MTAVGLLLGGLLPRLSPPMAGLFGVMAIDVAVGRARSRPKVLADGLCVAWVATIAWTVAGTLDDARHGAVAWATVVAVLVSIAIAIGMTWAWGVVAIVTGEVLRGRCAEPPLDPWLTFGAIALASLLGLGGGVLVAFSASSP